MSVEQRLRAGLAANTNHLSPNLDHELAVLRRRVHRRQQARRAGFGLAAIAAVAAGVVWLPGVVDSINGMDGRTDPAVERTETTPPVTVLGPGDDGTRLAAGVYAMTFRAPEADLLPRAVVQLPSDAFSAGAVLTSGAGATSRSLGLWTVETVAADPCDRPGGGYVDPGPTVADLAAALAAQPRKAGTDPVPVTIGGYDGSYLETSVPTDIDFDDCVDGLFVSWRTAGPGPESRVHAAPGEIDRLWILDVAGNRLVVSASHSPGVSTDQVTELTTIVESITFTNVNQP